MRASLWGSPQRRTCFVTMHDSCPDAAPNASADPPSVAPKRPQQLKLFNIGGAWDGRFDPQFFRTIPKTPGVYFFRDAIGKLLYIGQSHNLRDRVGSYRHVSLERHPRRTRRLVSQVRHITWELCESPEAAIQREKELILEHRPRFNRAGVWRAPDWWLVSHEAAAHSRVFTLVREPLSETVSKGPFPSSFPYVWAALVRVLWRERYPHHSVQHWPAGFHHSRRVAETRVEFGEEYAPLRLWLEQLLDASSDALLLASRTRLEESANTSPFEKLLWESDLEIATDFHERRRPLSESDQKSDDADESPLAEQTTPM